MSASKSLVPVVFSIIFTGLFLVGPAHASDGGPPAKKPIDALYAKYIAATNLGEGYAYFTALADSNPEALYFRGKIVETCTAFAGPIVERLEERIGKSPPSPVRMQTLSALKASCRDVPVQSLKVGGAELIREAAKRRDGKAQAHLFRFEPIGIGEKSFADTSQARSLALTLDPVTINNLDGYFEVRDRLLTWNIPGVEGTVSGREIANAMRLSACAMGYDCSATSIDVQIACAYRGFCEGDRIEQIRNHLMKPGEVERAEKIRDVILAGLATGKWPDGFWSGIGKAR